MSRRYQLRNIRALLTEGFSKDELRRLCYDVEEFRPVHDALTSKLNKSEIVDEIITYGYRRLLLDMLLNLVKQDNPRRYENHKPYYDDAPKTDRILLVDDSEDWRKQLGQLLQELGYQIMAVASKDEAIHHFTTAEPYDLVIIDLRLNDTDQDNKDGVKLGFWLRDNGYDLPIIIMSMYEVEGDVAMKATLRPFQFVVVDKARIGSRDFSDLLLQVELAVQQ